MDWYLAVLKQYAVFSGRARRKEYWFFFLFNFIANVILGVVDYMTGTFSETLSMGLLSGIYTVAVLIPSIAVSVRRLHDTNRSGWWLLIALVPFIGPLVVLIFMVLDGTPGDNRFGPDPKALTA